MAGNCHRIGFIWLRMWYILWKRQWIFGFYQILGVYLLSVTLQTSPCHVKLGIRDFLTPVSGKVVAVAAIRLRCPLEHYSASEDFCIHRYNTNYRRKHMTTAARKSTLYNTLIHGRFPRVPHKWPVSSREVIRIIFGQVEIDVVWRLQYNENTYGWYKSVGLLYTC